MAVARQGSNWWSTFFGVRQEARPLALDLLRGCYIREKQQAMRYREHAERMRYEQFREALIRMARVQDANAAALAEKIEALGQALPDLPPVDVADEQNSWYYLRSDLEEEQRTAGALSGDLVAIGAEFPESPSFSGASRMTAGRIARSFATCWRGAIRRRRRHDQNRRACQVPDRNPYFEIRADFSRHR